MYTEIIVTIIAILFMLAGLSGIFLPFLPGVPVVWLGFFVYAIFTEFQELSLLAVLIFLGLTVLSAIVDFIAPLLGAKSYKISTYGLVGASAGLLLGIATLGPIGIILGPFLGALLGELMSGKKYSAATKTALGTFVGFALSSLLRLGIAFSMIGFFLAKLLF